MAVTASLQYAIENLSMWLRAATVSVSGAPAIANYQYRVTVMWRPGMQTDFGDIRFTDNSGTKLHCFRISMVEGFKAVYWVKVPAASPTSFRMLYQGPVGSVVQQDGNGTFEFFDDFNGSAVDTTKWTYAWIDSIGVADGKLTLTQTVSNNWGYFAGKTSFGEGYALDWLLTAYQCSSSYYKHYFGWASPQSYYQSAYSTVAIPSLVSKVTGCTDLTLNAGVRTVGTITSVARYASKVYYYVGNVAPVITPATADTRVMFPEYQVRIYNDGNTSIHGMDWVFVRKFIDPEPTTIVQYPISTTPRLEYQIAGQPNAKRVQKTLEYTVGSVGTPSTTISVYTTVPYNYRKVVTINSPVQVGDYQHKVPVTWVAGMKTDFSDLYFTEVNGTKCPYWIETPTMGTAATAWVRVPHAGQKQLYMYYGNPALQGTNSNGKATFDFFDDFTRAGLDPALWSGPDWYASTSVAFSKDPATPNTLCTLKQYDVKSNSLYARVKVTGSIYNYSRMLIEWSTGANMTGTRLGVSTYTTNYWLRSVNAAGAHAGTGVGGWTDDKWIVVEIVKSQDGAVNTARFDHGSVNYTQQTYNDTGALQYIGASHYNEVSKISIDWVLLKKWVAATPTCTVESGSIRVRKASPRYIGVSGGAPITTSIEKTLQYRVWGHVNVQQSLRYQISPRVQKLLTYRVSCSPVVQKSLQYFLQNMSSYDITKDLKYCVPHTYTAPTQALKYVILTRRSLPLEYRFGSTTKIQKALWYFITTGVVYTVTMHGILEYVVASPKSITKSLAYQISPVVSQVLQYRVYAVHTVTKSLGYSLGTNVKKPLAYSVQHGAFPPVRKYLQYHVFAAPVITAAPTVGAWPMGVEFTASSSCPGITWSWDFGDGYSSGGRNPLHQYVTPATRYVACTASHANCPDLTSATIAITITEPEVIVYFETDKKTGTFPLVVKFSNLTTDRPGMTYDWDFGDGSTHSTEKNPTHRYGSPGNYDVTLTVNW